MGDREAPRRGGGVRENMFNYTTYDETESIEFVEIAPASELPNGERLFVEIEGKSIVIFNIAEQFFAIADVCTHDDGPLGDGDLEGYNIVCPRHGAEFDVRTGKVMQMPAVVDVPAYPVKVEDGMIQIGLPKE
jgi:3-phenylpropionate/trans-cinnamate dioxygenase ferredoxin component